MYGIEWVKSLSYPELARCNCMTMMRLFHYNVRYPQDLKKTVTLCKADAPGIVKVTVKLRTRDDCNFKLDYFMPEADAVYLRDELIADFKEYYNVTA